MALWGTSWSLVCLSPLPRSWLWVASAAVLMATAFVIWTYGRVTRPAALMLLRLLGGMAVLGFLCQPALMRRARHQRKTRLAIVADRSGSMQLPIDAAHSRIDAVRQFVGASSAALRRLEQRFVVQWYDLDGPIAASALALAPDATRTDLLAPLRQLIQSPNEAPLGAVVLLSDGADNAGAAPDGPALAESTRQCLANLQVPVNVVAFGAGRAVADVAVAHVDFDSYAFVHNTLTVDATIAMTGLASQSLAVTLLREGKPVATQNIDVHSDKPVHVVFRDKPDKVGSTAYSVQVPLPVGDALPRNNTRHFVVQVARDKTRILHVAGRPSWDERFLRQYLQQNANIDLVSFFILRTPENDMSIPEQELSLIPFPVGKLFTTELASFDVVIFQNFDFRLYQMQSYLQNIAQATRGGLGFVMIGGNDSFAEGGYVGTPMEDILPVRLPQAPQTGPILQALAPKLSDAGLHHPLTDLTLGTGDVAEAWQNLPRWTGANHIAGLMPSACSLVEDAHLRDAQGAAMPLLAAMEVGNGRSVAIATDAMWRWRFHPGDGGRGERAYQRLWANTLRYLVKDPEQQRVLVTPQKSTFEPHESIPLQLSALGRDYKKLPFAQLAVSVTKVGEAPVAPIDVKVGAEGNVLHTVAPLPDGAYRVVARTSAQGQQVGAGSAVFVVQPHNTEWVDTAPRPALLHDIAAASGGKSLQPGPNTWDKLAHRDSDVVELDRRHTVELWDNGFAFLLGALIWGGEWALRRQRGLP